MRRTEQFAYTASVLLVLGGIAILGAGAGVRMSIGVATHTLDCSAALPGQGFDCIPLVSQLNEHAWTFLIGGSVGLLAGLVGIWNVRRRYDIEAE